MREIPLSHNLATLVDDDVFERLGHLGWYTKRFGCGKTYVVRKTSRRADPQHKQFQVSLHREVLNLGAFDKRVVDHISGDTLDNRRANLRIATRAENNRNSRLRRDNKSGYKGVSLYRKTRWQASISFEGRVRHIGYFASKEQAAKAYNQEATRLFGAFASLNSIKES